MHITRKLDRVITSFSTCCRPAAYRQLLRGPGIRLQPKFSSTKPVATFKHVFIPFISVNCMRESSNRLYLNLELLISVPTTLYEKAFCFQRLNLYITKTKVIASKRFTTRHHRDRPAMACIIAVGI